MNGRIGPEPASRATRSAPSLGEITERILPILHAKSVRLALVFGSYARGTQDRKSDLDLILVVETTKRFFDRYDDFMSILTDFPGLSVDLLIYTPQEWEAMADRTFIRQIRLEGKIIYER